MKLALALSAEEAKEPTEFDRGGSGSVCIFCVCLSWCIGPKCL